MTTDKELSVAFAKAGNECGFDQVDVFFVAFKDFKVRWQRSMKWVDFQVSDYLNDAPIEVMEGLAKALFARISGQEMNTGYSPELTAWMTRPEFAVAK